jgi:hypothetical protein
MKTILPLLALLLLAGCSIAVPKTRIEGTLAGKPFIGQFPKDCSLQGLVVTSDTNGNLSLKIDTLSSKNSPDVIGASGAAYAQQVKALGDAFKAGVEAAGGAVGNAASNLK